MPAVPAPNTATSTSSTFLIAPPSLFSKWLNGIPLNVEPHSSSQVKPFACSSIMPESHMGANYVHRNCPRCCRSEEHTSELQSRPHLVCRLLLEKKKKYIITI